MSNLITNLIEATSLALGRNPELTWIDTTAKMLYDPESGPNDEANVGVSVVNAVACYVRLNPRMKQGAKSAMYVFNTSLYDSTKNYVITLTADGYAATNFTTTGESTVALAVAELVALINAASTGPLDPVAVGIPSTGTGDNDAVYVYAVEDFTTPAAPVLTCSISTTHASGTTETTGAFWGYVDPETFSARVWLKMTTPGTMPLTMPWDMAADGDFGVIPDEGYDKRLNVAAFERLYVEAYSITKFAADNAAMIGRPFVAIAPAILEED